jgi:hypothetical protein
MLHIPGDSENVWCVIDSCSIANGNPASRLLREHNAQLSLLAISHPHDDHATRFVDLFSYLTDNATVGAAWPRLIDESWERSLNARKHHLKGSAEAAIAAVLSTWQSDPARKWEMMRGQDKDIGACHVQVLNPETSTYANDFPDSINRLSTALLIEWENCRILLGGDVEKSDWTDIQNAGYKVKHNTCKVPHHGAANAFHCSWLESEEERCWCITPWQGGRLPWGHGGDIDTLLNTDGSISVTSDVGMPSERQSQTTGQEDRKPTEPSADILGDIALQPVSRPTDAYANYIAFGFDSSGNLVDKQLGQGAVSLS